MNISGSAYWIFAAKCAAVPLLIVWLGVFPLQIKKRRTAVFAEITAHAIAWSIVAFAALSSIPNFKNVFADFDVELPALSVAVIQASDAIVGGWWPLFFLVTGVLVVDGVMFAVFWDQNNSRLLRTSWSLLMMALPLVIVVVIEIAMLIPMSALLEQLS